MRGMPAPLLLSLIFILGFVNGLRTLTPVAVLCWGAHLGWFSLAHTPFFFLAHPISLIVFTVLALGEYIGDKLPKTPSRVSAFPLAGRVAFGAACGAVLATIAGATSTSTAQDAFQGHLQFGAPFFLSILVGGAAALVGSYAGFLLRRSLTRGAGLPDFPIAFAEDAVALGGAFFVVSRF